MLKNPELDFSMIPLLQETLQAALEKLRKEQQEAEKLEADIREQRTSWKVGGGISQGKLTEISSGCWLFLTSSSFSLSVDGFLIVGGCKCHIIGRLLILSLI